MRHSNIKLGKIASCRYGFGGYQDAMFGLSLTFNFGGSGCQHFEGAWANEPTEFSKWDLESQDNEFSKNTRSIIAYLQQAKVENITDLKGVPIEATFDGMVMTSWRILEEVL